VFLAAVLASSGCSVGDKLYHCDATHACQNGAQAGVCEPTGYCSFTDLGCVGVPRRYGSAAPDGIARFCVSATGDAGLADASLDAGGDATMTDAAPPDAMRDGAPVDAAPPSNCWSNLAAGPEHMCAWKSDGTYFCWGNPMNGRLGARQPAGPGQPVQGAAPPSPGSLSLGDEFTCGVASDNDLWCAGGNGAGQLGDGRGTADEDRALGPGRVVLGQLADAVKQRRAARVVEVLGRQRALLSGEPGPDIGGERVAFGRAPVVDRDRAGGGHGSTSQASRRPAKMFVRWGRSQLRNVAVAIFSSVAQEPPRSTR